MLYNELHNCFQISPLGALLSLGFVMEPPDCPDRAILGRLIAMYIGTAIKTNGWRKRISDSCESCFINAQVFQGENVSNCPENIPIVLGVAP